MANKLHRPIKHINLSFSTFIYIYIISLISFCMLSYLVSSYFTLNSLSFNPIGNYFNLELSLACLVHIKIGYFCLLSSIVIKSVTLGHATRRYYFSSEDHQSFPVSCLKCYSLYYSSIFFSLGLLTQAC